ncbi:hypothetical protein ACFPVX_16430 [Cohnella faecalis]|uniref:hypothetical protein n=1 Tax=Cohnella faecalis TaxID=2315694 RepID=UPI001314BBE5|nr:hypothetical protein [Cohnella faecalis]
MVQWNQNNENELAPVLSDAAPFSKVGVMIMAGIVAGLLVCAFVYVIRESLGSPEEEM